MTVDLCRTYFDAHAHSDYLDLDFENVRKVRPSCYTYYCTEVDRILLCCIASLYCTVLYCIALHYIVLCSIVFYEMKTLARTLPSRLPVS